MKSVISEEQKNEIINLYKVGSYSVDTLAEKFKVGKVKVKLILDEGGVIRNKRGGQLKGGITEVLASTSTLQYTSKDKRLIAICNTTGEVFNDANNLSGVLTTHIIETHGDVPIPTNTYQRKKYEFEHGKKWFEEYFTIEEITSQSMRKCSVCNWETADVENKTGCFINHLQTKHNSSLEEYLSIYPNDIRYHNNHVKVLQRRSELTVVDNYVECRLCGDRMKMINEKHLQSKHSLSLHQYKMKYPNQIIVSKSTNKKLSAAIKITNSNMEPKWTSKPELEIKQFLEDLGMEVEKSRNRKLLEGQEIDLIIPELKLAIEYNGLYYHTENMGKTMSYHLDKTLACAAVGYSLIHIFEDEWILNESLIKNKLKHLINKSDGKKIGARKCLIRKISVEDKRDFLKQHHIQGNDSSKICIGAYYNHILVGVMTFNNKRNMTDINKEVNGLYELTRFATHVNYTVAGLGSRVLKYFTEHYNPTSIISFADRRWTTNADSNLYTKLGFKLTSIVPPTYCYYNNRVNRFKRFHKFGFGKSSLKRKYPDMDFSKTEKQLTKELGYERIWDCGLLKYELVL